MEALIEVGIGVFDRVLETGKQLNAVHAAFAGIGGAILAAAAWFWSAEADPPVSPSAVIEPAPVSAAVEELP